MNKWDKRFLELARFYAGWSQDPSTKVGCVIVAGKNQHIGQGYNGFAVGVSDSALRLQDRETKLAMTIHAEINAVLSARQSIAGCTAYCWPMPPCSNCAAVLVQSGIARIVAPKPSDQHLERWGTSFDLAIEMYREKRVALDLVEFDLDQESDDVVCMWCEKNKQNKKFSFSKSALEAMEREANE